MLGAFICFALGLLTGSFLYNYAVRYGKKSVWRGRSECPRCRHALTARDLVPLLSYASLKGHCRYCRATISWKYPAFELATGTLFALVWLWLSPDLLEPGQLVGFALYLYLASVALTLTVIDIRQKLLPDKVVGPAAAAVVAYLVFETLGGRLTSADLFGHVAASLVAGGAFLAILAVSRGRWMGEGDVKLFALIGLLVGWPGVVVATLVAFWSAAIPSLILLGLGRRKMADQIPFGPFLLLGGAVALVWAEPIVEAYLTLLR